MLYICHKQLLKNLLVHMHVLFLCWLKYKSLAKTPLLFCKDSNIGIDKWGRNFFSEFSNPPLSSFMLLPMLLPGRSPKVLSMQVSIGVNSFPPLQKKTYISVILKKRFALLVRGFNICWGGTGDFTNA